MTVIPPMLLVDSISPPNRVSEWDVEIKWDGMRAVLYGEGDSVQIVTRHGKDVTRHFPEIADLPLPEGTVLDSEIVILEELDRLRITSPREMRRVGDASAVVFDLLRNQFSSTTSATYKDRRRMLAALGLKTQGFLTPSAWPGEDWDSAWEFMNSHELEGVVFKRLNSPYSPGKRSGAWRRLKATRNTWPIASWVNLERRKRR